jgi:hypothetical protein
MPEKRKRDIKLFLIRLQMTLGLSTQEQLAAALGINYHTLKNRLANPCRWTLEEIDSIQAAARREHLDFYEVIRL